MLLATAAVALWLSTLSGYTGSNDVQSFIWAAIVVTSGIAAASCRGRRRAFWAGFCGTMLLTTLRFVVTLYGAKLSWTVPAAKYLAATWQGNASPIGQQVLNMQSTLLLLSFLTAAAAIGFLSAFVYDRCSES